MSNTVIKIENLSKLYRLGEIGTGTLSHDINRWWIKLRGKEDPYSKIRQFNAHKNGKDVDHVWALKDINLEINQGEILGIIGRNGAGKSTLLKLISRITSPTTGSIKIKGRIASLLEVGTGFHPELTGRENIFMNGTVLGMSRNEIRKKFDDIVGFSEIEPFIDTPVKRYSSGMYVRLAFAVAAHLEPEILIVDEVLAVGDIAFQKKCLNKMGEVGKEGRTVLFVSHNMAAVSSLTRHAILLGGGGIMNQGYTDNVIQWYLNILRENTPSVPIIDRVDREGSGRARVVDLYIDDTKGHVNTIPLSRHSKRVNIGIEAKERITGASIAVSVFDSDRRRMIWMDSSLDNELFTFEKGTHEIRIDLASGFSLSPGEYFLNIALISVDGIVDYVGDALNFTVVTGDFFGFGKYPKSNPMIYVDQQWVINGSRIRCIK